MAKTLFRWITVLVLLSACSNNDKANEIPEQDITINEKQVSDSEVKETPATDSKEEKKVYICKGPYSHSYHNSTTCRGLKRCSTPLDTVTLTKAVNELRRDPCDWCYGH